MKRWLLVAVSCLAMTASAAEWQKELTPPLPGAFPAMRPLTARYKFGWSAFTAAEADFDLSRNRAGLLRLSLHTKTLGFVRGLWRLDAQHTSLIRPGTFQPVSVVQTETYSDETRTTRLVFDGEGVVRTRDVNPPEPGEKKKAKRFESPSLFDLHGALQFLRSQPLRSGESYKIVVYPSSSPYLVQLNVLGRERVEASGKKYDAIKLDLKLSRIDYDDLELKPYAKFKRANLWVADDADRLLVKVAAEIMVGSVWAELDRVEFR